MHIPNCDSLRLRQNCWEHIVEREGREVVRAG